MSRSERDKGARGEREVAELFRAHGFDAERTPNSGGLMIRGDLAGSVPAHLEVKRQEVLRLPTWMRQAEADAPEGVVPVVCYRQNSGRWYATLPLADLAALIRKSADSQAEWDAVVGGSRGV